MRHKPDSVTLIGRRSSVYAARTRNSSVAGSDSFPIWPCSGRGLHCRRDCSTPRRALTPPFHPCRIAPAVCFLLRYPFRGIWSAASSLTEDSPPCGVRTFLPVFTRRPPPASLKLYNIHPIFRKSNFSIDNFKSFLIHQRFLAYIFSVIYGLSEILPFL